MLLKNAREPGASGSERALPCLRPLSSLCPQQLGWWHSQWGVSYLYSACGTLIPSRHTQNSVLPALQVSLSPDELTHKMNHDTRYVPTPGVVPFLALENDLDLLRPAWRPPARAEADLPGCASSGTANLRCIVFTSPVLPAPWGFIFLKSFLYFLKLYREVWG